MVHRFQCGYTLRWVISQEFLDQVFGFLDDIFPLGLFKGVLAREDRLDNLLVRLAIEWRVSCQQNVENDATTPQVTLLVIAFLQHLWGDVIRRAELLTHLFIVLEDARRAKVDNRHLRSVAILVQQQILRFQITMHYIAAVTVIDR